VPGISGTKAEGADSIVVSGGYKDDEDYGAEIIYTGAGGNDLGTGRQIDDQTIGQPGNAGLVTSQLMACPFGSFAARGVTRPTRPPAGTGMTVSTG
jgi:putative restriction endonuclease